MGSWNYRFPLLPAQGSAPCCSAPQTLLIQSQHSWVRRALTAPTPALGWLLPQLRLPSAHPWPEQHWGRSTGRAARAALEALHAPPPGGSPRRPPPEHFRPAPEVPPVSGSAVPVGRGRAVTGPRLGKGGAAPSPSPRSRWGRALQGVRAG